MYHFLIILLDVTIICALRVVYICYIRMVEILWDVMQLCILPNSILSDVTGVA